jgi:hypothetical protein
MQHQSQEELKYIQQRLNMELGYGKLELGEAKVRLAEEKLARSREQYGKPKATDVEKNYESAFRAQQNAAKALAERPGDKNLKGMYEKATVNVDRLARMRDQIYGDVAKGQGSKFQEQLAGFAKQGGAWSPETHSQLLKSIPQELMASMRPEEQQQLTKILLANPDRADEILAWLKKKGTHETTIGKSDGGYYR